MTPTVNLRRLTIKTLFTLLNLRLLPLLLLFSLINLTAQVYLNTFNKSAVFQNIIPVSTSRSPTKTTRTIGIHTIAQAIKSEVTQLPKGPLSGKTIVLDPGHGGIDDGTTSPISGSHEKTLTLATALEVEQKLKNAGAHVIMTRTTDTYISLQQRSEISNKNHADAFISLHYNESSVRSASGILDFYYEKSKDGRLAEDILKQVVRKTGLKNDGTRFDNLDVLRNNTQPCTLIELGFLSNKDDDARVENSVFREDVAQGVYQGLLDYFSNHN